MATLNTMNMNTLNTVGRLRRSVGSRAGKFAGIGVAVLSILFVSGCSLVNPHIDLKPIPSSEYKIDPKVLKTQLEQRKRDGTLGKDEYDSRLKLLAVIEFRGKERIPYSRALQYADDARKAYKVALADQAELQSWLGIGLIPLSAAAVGLGVAGVSSHAVLALGLTGAAGYGTGTWLINQPRQRAYVAGYNAITCAVEATQPFGFTLSEQIAFEADLGLLRSHLRETDAQVGLVETWTEAVERLAGPKDSQVTFAKQRVINAKALIGTAEQALGNGGKLKIEVINSGRNLSTAVDKIGGEVQAMIVATQLDLSKLFTIINGLGASYANFTAVPDSLKPAEAGKRIEPPSRRGAGPEKALTIPARADLTTHLVKLVEAMANLADAKRKVADVVNAIDVGSTSAKLANCGVDKATIVSALIVDPAGPFQITQGKNGSVAFQIKGGQRPFHASLPANSPAGLSIEQKPGPFARGVVVAADEKVAAGSYVVSISDGSGERSTSVTVVVGEGQAESM